MNVLLAAPSGLLGEALARLIGEVVPEAQIRPFPMTDAAGTALPEGPMELVLIDIDNLPEHGAGAVALCASKYPGAPVVAVAEPRDAESMDRILRAGATGYLPKNYSHAMMQSVLRLVLEGTRYRPVLPDPKDASAAASLEDLGLTPRQAEVLSLLAQGKSNETIAKQLGISVGVVKLHINAIFKALNVQSRTEAVLIAVRYGAVSPQQLRDAEAGKFSLDWLLPHMRYARLKRDSVLFRKGDPGKDLYYLQRGTVRLVDLEREMNAGELFGEIAIFSPDHRRTSTAICASDVDIFSLDADQVRRIYASNPHFALYLVYLIARRLMADRAQVG